MAFFISGQLGVVYYLLDQTDPCCQIGRVTAFASEVIGGDHLRTKYALEKSCTTVLKETQWNLAEKLGGLQYGQMFNSFTNFGPKEVQIIE